jgi:hypothetical protein
VLQLAGAECDLFPEADAAPSAGGSPLLTIISVPSARTI